MGCYIDRQWATLRHLLDKPNPDSLHQKLNNFSGFVVAKPDNEKAYFFKFKYLTFSDGADRDENKGVCKFMRPNQLRGRVYNMSYST